MPPRHGRRVFALLLIVLALAVSALAQERLPAAGSRPAALVPLCASFGALQVADAATTFRALDGGAREVNPMLAGIADNRGALIAVKAASTTAIIFAGEKLWRRNRVAAVAMMVALNGVYAAIAVHNYRAVR